MRGLGLGLDTVGLVNITENNWLTMTRCVVITVRNHGATTAAIVATTEVHQTQTGLYCHTSVGGSDSDKSETFRLVVV